MKEDKQLKRINKYLTEIGYCSRCAADKLVENGQVTINDEPTKLGTKIKIGDVVKVNGEIVANPNKQHIYMAFNKPIGIVCTTNTATEKNNIIDYINYTERIFPIGRLDKLSEGLIFLTSDGDIVNKILRAKNNHEKEYIVTVNKMISADFIKKMRSGIPILGTVTHKCFVEQLSNTVFKIILTQGLNKQIRRMCDYLDYTVVKLKRIRIMNINLDIPIGKWRYLKKEEMEVINKMLAHSTKTAEK